jgi:hypothetical protein
MGQWRTPAPARRLWTAGRRYHRREPASAATATAQTSPTRALRNQLPLIPTSAPGRQRSRLPPPGPRPGIRGHARLPDATHQILLQFRLLRELLFRPVVRVPARERRPARSRAASHREATPTFCHRARLSRPRALLQCSGALDAALDCELLVDVPEARLVSLVRDEKLLRDLWVREAAGRDSPIRRSLESTPALTKGKPRLLPAARPRGRRIGGSGRLVVGCAEFGR